jgi:hypothetical protein
MTEQPATEKQLQRAESKIEERMSAFERSMLRLTAAAVAISIITGLVFVGQLYEMWQAGKQTDKMIGAANIEARASRCFSKSAEGINTEITDAVTQLGFQVDALRDNVKQTNGLAAATKDGISENRSAIRLENRAWLGVTNETMVQFVPGRPIKLDIFLTNSGRTPANSVQTAVSVSVDTKIMDLDMNFKDFVSTASVPPQGSHVIHVTSKGQLTGIQAAKIENKSLLLVVRGTVDYEDFNGVPRSTNICMYMADPATKEIIFCQTGNEMN